MEGGGGGFGGGADCDGGGGGAMAGEVERDRMMREWSLRREWNPERVLG